MAAALFGRRFLGRPLPSLIRLGFRRYSAETGSKEYLEQLVKGNKVVLFMKGVPSEPMCGFSNAVVQILRMHGVDDYSSYNVLEDEDLRQGIKDYSSWPTIPQIYINGEFIGGCEIMLQMHQNGEFVEELEKVGIKSVLLEKHEGEHLKSNDSDDKYTVTVWCEWYH